MPRPSFFRLTGASFVSQTDLNRVMHAELISCTSPKRFHPSTLQRCYDHMLGAQVTRGTPEMCQKLGNNRGVFWYHIPINCSSTVEHGVDPFRSSPKKHLPNNDADNDALNFRRGKGVRAPRASNWPDLGVPNRVSLRPPLKPLAVRFETMT